MSEDHWPGHGGQWGKDSYRCNYHPLPAPLPTQLLQEPRAPAAIGHPRFRASCIPTSKTPCLAGTLVLFCFGFRSQITD